MFYNGLNGKTRSNIDAVASGSLMGKTEETTFKLLEEMTANNYQWPMERLGGWWSQGVHKIDAFFAVNIKLDTLAQRLDKMGLQGGYLSLKAVCKICGGRHEIAECQVGSPFASSE